jgi:ribosomal-protein-alanine N-acetyltransferase
MLGGLLDRYRDSEASARPRRYEATEVAFGPLLEADMPVVERIERATYRTPWPASLFRDLMADPKHTVVGVKSGRRLLGYFVYEERGKIGHISNFCVRPENRRQGVGTTMMGHLLNLMRDKDLDAAELEVRAGNEAARSFYGRFGFSVRETVPHFYQDTGDDALVMRKELRKEGF